jgi:hypothetical protein
VRCGEGGFGLEFLRDVGIDVEDENGEIAFWGWFDVRCIP